MSTTSVKIDKTTAISLISQCTAKKEKYEAAIALGESIISSTKALADGANDINTLLSQIVISGNPVGDNAFGEMIRGQLTNYEGTINSVIVKCNNKLNEINGEISYYQSMISDSGSGR